MKLYQFLLCLYACFVVTECRSYWNPLQIGEIALNKTYDIKDYFVGKTYEVGRSLSEVTGKVFNHLSDTKSQITAKFKEYIEKAKSSGRSLVDTIKLKRLGDNCTEQISEDFFTTPQLIAANGYPAESHVVTTEDGYLLTVHRIPHSKHLKTKDVSPKTVLLHHGLLGSSADWVLAGPIKSLAYILSDAGYDVWLANVRGNTYSRAHETRKIDSYEFWNFTWHEVSQKDLPAVIDYIIALKGVDAKINYVGHSMGTTVLFALLSTKPEYNMKLRAGFALAPVAYMSQIESPIRLLAPIANDLNYILRLLGANEFLPQNWLLRWLSEHACEINHYEEIICENSMLVLCGHDSSQFNKTLLPIILSHIPAGASSKTLVHYAQEIHSEGRFQQFDYGEAQNLIAYGTAKPPAYEIRNITLPIALLSAKNDWLSGMRDVERLYTELPNKIEHYIVPLDSFNHIDFLWAIDAPKLVHKKLLQLMEKGFGGKIQP